MPRPKPPRKHQPAADDAPEKHGLPALSPDTVEQESGDDLDDIVPTAGYGELQVVGLGGSAGGLAALQKFFAGTAPDTGSAFVVIMHLSPEHESILAELLQRNTAMPVQQVRDRIKVEPNQVYVIPPAKNLSMADGHLNLSEPAERPGKHVAVDLFFRTLADTHGPKSTAVVLSGADSDGAIGIKRIKERGGLTVAQEPSEAEHGSMPRASIATGMVDWVLPVAEMPAKLAEYWRVGSRLQLPVEDGPQPGRKTAAESDGGAPAAENALNDILSFLRVRTGHDFSYYKRATILRRIGRRLQINGIEELPVYLAYMRTHPGEPTALLQDLLISVTNFFRDRDAFAALEEIIPQLFVGKGPRDEVRVWVAACATGEEAYSVAMLLHEHAATLDQPPSLQVFATDLDENAISAAREGVYPETIAADVSLERLKRYFSKGHGYHKVKRELRELVLFALHDLLKDSPFSRIDLISCRNLLIYLNRDAQNRALDIFHFALRAEGRLFLGSSESVDDGSPLFVVTDKKRRLYLRRGTSRPGLQLLPGPSTLTRALHRGEPRLSPSPASAKPAAERETSPTSWGGIHYEFIERLSPPSVIVNQNHDVLHLSENAGRFLQLSGGEPTMNILRVVHPMLRVELRAALYRASQSLAPTETRDVPVEIDGAPRAVTIRVSPSTNPSSLNLLLVVFQEGGPAQSAPAALAGEGPDSVLRQLERELENTKTQLRDTIEEAEASSEELKASNEELQAMNEELRSASEELETGREELQSINEELTTVNQEMRSKVEQLGRSNSDLQNLMAATQIGTVFLDRSLCIQRYTPPAVALFNLIPSDVGRPLAHLTHRLLYQNLAADAERVLEQLGSVELEVSHEDGRAFLARMLPYRTLEDHIAGVVLTFVDITERRQAEDALRASEERFRATTDSISQIVWRADGAGNFEFFNRQWVRYTGEARPPKSWSEYVSSFVHPDDRGTSLEAFAAARQKGAPLKVEHRIRAASGDYQWFLVRAEHEGAGPAVQWFGTATNISDHMRDDAELKSLADRLRLALEAARLGTWDWNMETGLVVWSPEHNEMYDLPRGQVEGSYEIWQEKVHPDDRERVKTALAAAIAERRDFAAEMRSLHQDGTVRWIVGNARTVYSAQGKPQRMIGVVRDVTDMHRAEQARHEMEDRFALVVQSVEDYAIYMLDPEGIMTTWNRGAERIKGWSEKEAIGQSLAICSTPEDRAAGRPEQELAIAARDGRVQEEGWRMRKSGERYWADELLVALYTEGGGEVIAYAKFCRDLSDRKRLEDERGALLAAERTARSEAEQINAAKDRFLAVLSHELRAPLAPVQMALYALTREKRLSDRGRESLQMIVRNVESETRLIDDLLDVSRIVHGKLDLTRKPLDVHACIERAVEICHSDLQAKDLRLTQELRATRSGIEGDPGRLQQVFWNLIKNAAKFSPEGAEITLRSSDCPNDDGTNAICVEIIDTGIGVAPEALPKLFDAFEQGGAEVTRLYGGLGLGLAISHAIVREHGGTITGASKGRGEGATFTVRLSPTSKSDNK